MNTLFNARTANLSLILAAMILCGVLRAQENRGVAVESTKGQKWAVLVGVNDYAEQDDLSFCRKDAEALAAQLVRAGFPKENVFLLTDGASDSKNRPTKANIETRIRNVLSVAEKGDLVLVSFSGHGMHVDGKTYLCPTGARVDSPDSTMIKLQLVYAGLNKCSATRRLLWVDACRNDPRPRGSKDATGHSRNMKSFARSLQEPPEGILTLASCAAGQISWEDGKFGHGVFMNFLLEGLSGKADSEERGNKDKKVSLLELYNYANIKTKRFVLNSRDPVQTPELFGRITGDFDIVASVSLPRPPPVPVLRELPKDFINSVGMKLKLIPAGEFIMGSPENEKNRSSDEGPVHRVKITKPYYLGVYEVTQGQYKR